jgi:hypothetical protein
MMISFSGTHSQKKSFYSRYFFMSGMVFPIVSTIEFFINCLNGIDYSLSIA